MVNAAHLGAVDRILKITIMSSFSEKNKKNTSHLFRVTSWIPTSSQLGISHSKGTKISHPSNLKGQLQLLQQLGGNSQLLPFFNKAQPKQLQMTCDQLESHYRPQGLGEFTRLPWIQGTRITYISTTETGSLENHRLKSRDFWMGYVI